MGWRLTDICGWIDGLLTAARVHSGTLHGMRSLFRDWFGETSVIREVSEACLCRMGLATLLNRLTQWSDLLKRRRARSWSLGGVRWQAGSSRDALSPP